MAFRYIHSCGSCGATVDQWPLREIVGTHTGVNERSVFESLACGHRGHAARFRDDAIRLGVKVPQGRRCYKCHRRECGKT